MAVSREGGCQSELPGSVFEDRLAEEGAPSGMHRRVAIAAGLAGLAGIAALTRSAKAGPLNPPAGPIAPTGKTAQEIHDKIARTDVGLAEPRIPVQSLPGSATAVHVISQPGSYYLTANILGAAGKNGIDIAADNVAVDLGGFSLIGNGGDVGILTTIPGFRQLTIRNGRVRGWNFRCVDVLGSDAVLEDLVCLTCPHGGLVAGTGCIRRCWVRDTGDWGIRVVERSLVEACSVGNCGGTGIVIAGGPGGIIIDCKVDACTVGIDANRAHVARCGVVNCGQAGIRAREECSIEHNAVGSVDGAGIDVTGPSTVVRWNSVTTTQTCVRSTSTSGLFAGNTAQPRSGGTGYAIPAGNSFGPLVNVAGVGDIAAVANANHPWANFIH